MPFSEDTVLEISFDGTDLGLINARKIKWWEPVCARKGRYPDFYVKLKMEKGYIPGIISLNRTKTPIRCIVDEFKPFFGLTKLGSHTLTMTHGLSWVDPSKRYTYLEDGSLGITFTRKKTHWYLFRTPYYIEDGKIKFIKHQELTKEILLSSDGIFREVQKIFVFRSLVRLRTGLKHIILRSNKGVGEYPVSYDESKTLFALKDKDIERDVKLSLEVNDLLFPKSTDKEEILRTMLGYSVEDTIPLLHQRLTAVVKRIDVSFLEFPDLIIDEITNRLEI